jgi:hypothetical protein
LEVWKFSRHTQWGNIPVGVLSFLVVFSQPRDWLVACTTITPHTCSEAYITTGVLCSDRIGQDQAWWKTETRKAHSRDTVGIFLSLARRQGIGAIFVFSSVKYENKLGTRLLGSRISSIALQIRWRGVPVFTFSFPHFTLVSRHGGRTDGTDGNDDVLVFWLVRLGKKEES